MSFTKYVLTWMAMLLVSMPCNAQDYKNTGLPVCYIFTENNRQITSKQEYIPAWMTLVNGQDTLLSNVALSIRGRGNATWHSYPKKPYKLKFNNNLDILTNYGKHFTLLPNYCDKSLMRTAIGFETCRLLEMEWVPADDYVEFVLNDEYLGNYQLVETVRANKNRLNLTGTGFLLQYDKYWYANDSVYFFTDKYQYPLIVKHPDEDEITDEQFEYIKYAMNDFEAELENSLYVQKLMDLDSFAKWYYASNVLALMDGNYYLYKYDDSDSTCISMGPLWDFEWSLGTGWYDGVRPNPNHQLVGSFYFEQLSQHDFFMKKIQQLHQDYGAIIKENILAYYDVLTARLQLSQKANFNRWKILNTKVSVGGIPLGSWEAEVACDRAFFENHFQYIDQIFNINTATGVSIASSESPDLSDGAAYTISGQRVNRRALGKGIYIINNKKYVR